ncbi:unnamed protein product, partial [Rotaria magnacalcarata]
LQNYCRSRLYTSSSTLNQRLENLKLSFSNRTQHKKSSYYYQLIENSKRCIVALETNYRDALELNTTYLVGKTLEGETMLLPKQLMEQGDVITIGENSTIDNERLDEINSHLSVEQRSDVYDDKYLVLSNTKALAIDATITKTKSNFFGPALSSNAYVGHMQENERIVEVKPCLSATDDDPSNSPNGQICGYELSSHKHDDGVDGTSENIPFIVELINGKPSVQLKTSINKLDCEIKQSYRLFVRAYDCASSSERRYSERSSLVITLDDVNEFVPMFTHKSYLFKLHQDQNCLSCRVEATDDDCSNADHRVCDYQIRTPDVPFTIDSNGSISIKAPLTNDKYEFDVVAIDCYMSSLENATRAISEPSRVTIKIIKSCKPTISGRKFYFSLI